MRRIVHLCFAALAVLTAVALLTTAAALRGPALDPLLAKNDDAANRALAYRFYEVANAAIATGDPSGLAALLAADFIDAASEADAESDRQALIHRFLYLHATAPDVRLVAELVATDDDLAIAQVRVVWPGTLPPGNLPADPAWRPWGEVDAFRIADGRIVERRGPALDPVPTSSGSQFRTELPSLSPRLRTLTAARIVLDPGARYSAPTLADPRYLLVETGTVAVDAHRGLPAAPTDMLGHRLGSGEHVSLPERTQLIVTNRGSAAAVLFDVSLSAAPWSDAPPPPAPWSDEPGIDVTVLADGLLVEVPGQAVTLAVDHRHMFEGDRLDLAAFDGPALLHVEEGEVELTETDDVVWISNGHRRADLGGAAFLPSGRSALIFAGAEADIRVSQPVPATVLLVTLSPTDAGQ